MNPAKGYYSLIQYCPDLSRLEAANIGVLLFCPDKFFLQAKTVRNNRRIQKFFGREGHDWDRIDSFKLGLEERVEAENGEIITLSDLERFIALRANEIQITAPRPMRVEDPKKDLENLFDELVEQQQPKDQVEISFRRLLAQKLKKPTLRKKVLTNVPVVVHVLARQIEVPYGFQNGRFNLIQPARFRGEGLDQAERTACKYAIEGRSLYDHRDRRLGNLKLIVVGEFGGQDGNKQTSVKRILNDNKVELYTETELDCLVDQIETTGKILS
jgi:hypothetical protein